MKVTRRQVKHPASERAEEHDGDKEYGMKTLWFTTAEEVEQAILYGRPIEYYSVKVPTETSIKRHRQYENRKARAEDVFEEE